MPPAWSGRQLRDSAERPEPPARSSYFEWPRDPCPSLRDPPLETPRTLRATPLDGPSYSLSPVRWARRSHDRVRARITDRPSTRERSRWSFACRSRAVEHKPLRLEAARSRKMQDQLSVGVFSM